MRRPFLMLFLIAAAMLPCGCGAARMHYTRAQVVDAVTAAPLVEADIVTVLLNADGEFKRVRSTISDKHGVFMVRLLREHKRWHDYRIRIEKEGYLPEVVTLEELHAISGGTMIGTGNSEVFAVVRLERTPARLPTPAMDESGRMTPAAETPVPSGTGAGLAPANSTRRTWE